MTTGLLQFPVTDRQTDRQHIPQSQVSLSHVCFWLVLGIEPRALQMLSMGFATVLQWCLSGRVNSGFIKLEERREDSRCDRKEWLSLFVVAE